MYSPNSHSCTLIESIITTHSLHVYHFTSPFTSYQTNSLLLGSIVQISYIPPPFPRFLLFTPSLSPSCLKQSSSVSLFTKPLPEAIGRRRPSCTPPSKGRDSTAGQAVKKPCPLRSASASNLSSHCQSTLMNYTSSSSPTCPARVSQCLLPVPQQRACLFVAGN